MAMSVRAFPQRSVLSQGETERVVVRGHRKTYSTCEMPRNSPRTSFARHADGISARRKLLKGLVILQLLELRISALSAANMATCPSRSATAWTSAAMCP